MLSNEMDPFKFQFLQLQNENYNRIDGLYNCPGFCTFKNSRVFSEVLWVCTSKCWNPFGLKLTKGLF